MLLIRIMTSHSPHAVMKRSGEGGAIVHLPFIIDVATRCCPFLGDLA